MVLFLESYDIENMPSSLLNPVQSAYMFAPAVQALQAREATRDITQLDITQFNEEDMEFESVNGNNNLTLTMADLLQITGDSRR